MKPIVDSIPALSGEDVTLSLVAPLAFTVKQSAEPQPSDDTVTVVKDTIEDAPEQFETVIDITDQEVETGVDSTFQVLVIEKELESATDVNPTKIIKSILRKHLHRLDPYLDPESIYCAATALDIRTKQAVFITDATWHAIEVFAKSLPHGATTTSAAKRPCPPPLTHLWQRALPVNATVTAAPMIKDKVRAQLQAFKYLEGAPEVIDPLRWWSDKKGSYSELAMVAMSLLSIPATEVPSERMFSTAGTTFRELRSRMSPQVLEDLLFVHRNHPMIVAWRSSLKEDSDV